MEPVTSILAFLFFGFIAIVLLVIAAKTIRIVPQATVMLVERLGKFDKVASSGLNILVPFLDKPRAVYWTNTRPGLTSIDLREQYIDLPPQPVITRDNVTIHVDSVVYWQITDPVKAYDYRHARGYGRHGPGPYALATRSDQFETTPDPRRSH
jgi:regulator of protease activity HflC (stomatin/prohibitin superfamily)